MKSLSPFGSSNWSGDRMSGDMISGSGISGAGITDFNNLGSTGLQIRAGMSGGKRRRARRSSNRKRM